ncbi:hypothetical protein HaLaN_03827 [Haematococcus lacustris]|uniref:Uncharacterized protein n=1 Tax=Haematococcus lacustris TaxID=44745 RepID=A0A699Z0D7_HAELA|nr:hypothetical protein HaLaN_03827 [Haematococcus lacustris]
MGERLEKDMAEVSMERHGHAKQLVVFFGAASIGTGAKRTKRTKAEQAAEPTQPTKGKGEGKAVKAKPAPQPGRWLDRDCNAALNMQRIGESRPGTTSGFTCRLLSDQLLNDNPVLLEYLAQAVLAEGQAAVQARPRSSGPLGSSSDVGVGAASGSLVRRLRATASACSATQDLHPAELAAGQALQL